jgi:Spy/CpxP family protein refolding chaperone
MKKISKLFIILVVVGVLGFGINAFAHMGKGYGPSGWGNHGSGGHHMGSGGPGYGHMMGDLNDDDFKKMEEERRAFFKETETLRREVYQKELALESELAKKNPDAQKAVSLQKEISDFKAQLDQKRIEHMIRMRGIFPDAGGRYMGRGHMMGYGSGYGGDCRR